MLDSSGNMELTNRTIITTAGVSMKDLLATDNIDLPKPGSVVDGTILSSGKNAVMVDLGSFGTGIVYPGEFYDNTTLQKSLKAGQKISAVIQRIRINQTSSRNPLIFIFSSI